MGSTKELRMGTSIEREHRPTVNYIKGYLRKFGRLPPEKKIYQHIAANHLNENKNYYSILKRSKL